jgi:hypothetical protein
MERFEPTPGPWPVSRTGDGKRYVIGDGLVEGPGGYEVAEVYSDDCDPVVALANTNLIAAAPELYAALTDLRAFVGVMVGRGADCIIPEKIDTPLGIPVKIGAIMRDAETALAKARGEG